MDFSVPMYEISMDFGNDQAPGTGYGTASGDEAVLRMYTSGGTLVATRRVTMNLNDNVDQTISYEGMGFRYAILFYEISDPSLGLIEMVDNIQLNTVPEPGTLALLGIGVFGLAAWQVRRRKRKSA
jgi:hypothetical protein